MHGNSFFNPYMYQPYQTSNLMNGLGSMRGSGNLGRSIGSFSRNSGLGSTVGSLGSAASSVGGSSNTLGLKGLLSKFSFGGFLDGASKTLNVVNQAIPIFYQVKPMISNAKTMFRIMGAVKDDDSSKVTSRNTTQNNIINNSSSSSNTITTSRNIDYQTYNEENPAFFI